MHWLPLVAMVIASALPFPRSPQLRLVVATTNFSQNLDNRRLENISVTEAGASSPAKVPMDYNSHSNVSGKNYSAAAGKDSEATQHRAVDHLQSTVENLSSVELKWQRDQITKGKLNKQSLLNKQSQKPSKPKHALGDLKQQTRSNARSIRQQDNGDYKIHDFPSQVDNSDSYHTSLDSKPKFKQIDSQVRLRTGSLDTPRSDETRLLGTDGADSHTQDDKLLGADYTSELSEGLTLPGSEAGDGTLKQRGVSEENQGQESVERDAGETWGVGWGTGYGDGSLLADEDLLFLDSHPRVLFSSSPSPPKHPPLLLMLERDLLAGSEGAEDGAWENDEGEGAEADADADTRQLHRKRRRSLSAGSSHSKVVQHWPEQTMCPERSDWVTDKQTAVDAHHRTVTVLPEIPTLNGNIKQFFYETRCREDHMSQSQNPSTMGEQTGGGCVGVDKRQWNSSCQTRQSFVRALTGDAKRRRWTWIRVNSSCVCVLSRVNKAKPMRIEGKR